MRDRFHIGRALHRLLPRQVQVLYGFLCIATARVVMRQLAVMVVQGGAVEGFNGLRRALMDGFAPLVQHRAVGYLLGQGVPPAPPARSGRYEFQWVLSPADSGRARRSTRPPQPGSVPLLP